MNLYYGVLPLVLLLLLLVLFGNLCPQTNPIMPVIIAIAVETTDLSITQRINKRKDAIVSTDIFNVFSCHNGLSERFL